MPRTTGLEKMPQSSNFVVFAKTDGPTEVADTMLIGVLLGHIEEPGRRIERKHARTAERRLASA